MKNVKQSFVFTKALHIPDEVIFSKRLVVSGVEAVSILLKRFSYPIRLGDMIASLVVQSHNYV